jgi:hypothetical protein
LKHTKEESGCPSIRDYIKIFANLQNGESRF